MSSPASEAVAIPSAATASSDPEPLLSPSAVSIHCQERMFPTEEDDAEPNGGGGDDPGSVEAEAEAASLAPSMFEDARSTVTMTDIEERLRVASMSGSIHELQDEARNPEAASDGHDDSTPVENRLGDGDEDEEEDDSFEDAREDLQSTPQHGPPTVKRSFSDASAESSGGVNSAEWRQNRKHVFVLSDAGKPIFTLHGDEDELASLMAVMQAMVSYVQDMGDSLRSLVVAGKKVVFLTKGPLILVATSRGKESIPQLTVQLTYIYNQILSVLTLSQLTRIFETRKGFDLRRMIAGSERLIRSLSSAMDTDPCFMLGSVRVLPMPSSSREDISKAISKECARAKNVVFAILIANNQLVTLTRMKKYYIHPADLHLIFSLINSTESFKMSEAWIPICLPKFDSSGFMQAHVSYLSDDCPACLMMLTVERDIFFELSEAKGRIMQALQKTNSLSAINEALNKADYSPSSIGIPDVRHFLYKAKSAAQFTSSARLQPYVGEEPQRRLHETYLQLQNRMHSTLRPLKLIYYAEQYENVLGWATQAFELYAAFAPTKSKTAAISAINKLVKWCKKEEGSLFILNSPTF